MNEYEHYIRTNEDEMIIHGFSSAFEQPLESDILIAECESRHFHEVWNEPLINELGQFRFLWIDGEQVERTQEELDEEYENNKPPIVKTEEQLKIEQLESDNLLLLFAMTDLYEEKERQIEAANIDAINNMMALTELYEFNLELLNRLDNLENGGIE